MAILGPERSVPLIEGSARQNGREYAPAPGRPGFFVEVHEAAKEQLGAALTDVQGVANGGAVTQPTTSFSNAKDSAQPSALAGSVPTLQALLLSSSAATVGQAFSATISGRTAGSTLSLSGAGAAGLSISGTTVSGTPTTAGSVNLVETLAGATNSPRTTSGAVTVSAVVGPVTDAAITSINASGWTASDSAASALRPSGRSIVLDRQGFDGLGQPTTYRETIPLTQRVRQPFNSAYSSLASAYLNASNPPLDATATALADYAYASDTVVGGSAVNSSAETSPKPIANWARVDHRVLVGNSFPAEWAELVAFHRNARNREQVAAVVFEWKDTNGATVTRTVSASVISGSANDKNSVIVYRPPANVDLSALADGTITLNAKVYPWIGTAASLLDSSTGTLGGNAFSPQVFVKQAAPIRYAYVGTGGTGVVSTDPAVAAANPYPSIVAATNGLIAANGNTSGTEIRLTEGTWATATSNANTQGAGEAIITAAPGAAKANTIIQVAAAWTTNQNYLRIKGVTVQRTAAVFIRLLGTATASKLVLEDVILDSTAGNASLTNAAPVYLHGVTVAAPVTSLFNPSTNCEVRMLRGVDYGALNGGAINVEGRLILGSTLRGVVIATLGVAGRGKTGTILAYSKMLGLGSGTPAMGFGTLDVVGAAVVQNVFEWTSTTSNASFRPSGDTDTPNVTHLVVHNNTFAGYNIYGRANALYNEGAAARTHKLQSWVQNIHVQVNTKHDVFYGIQNQPNNYAEAANRTGGWAFMYGVGVRDEVYQYPDGAGAVNGTGGQGSMAFPGTNAACGTSATAISAVSDPKFTNNQAAKWSGAGTTATAGVGNGDYSLQPGSVAVGRGTNPVLRFYLDGSTRPTASDNAGAMATAA